MNKRRKSEDEIATTTKQKQTPQLPNSNPYLLIRLTGLHQKGVAAKRFQMVNKLNRVGCSDEKIFCCSAVDVLLVHFTLF